jgi:predicted Zn-dependent peptidase
MRSSQTELVSTEELAKVKEYMVGNMLLELESSDAYANFYGGQAVLRRPLRTPREAEKRVRTVTAEDIQKVAKQVFTTKTLNLALIGPYTKADEKVFAKLLRV